jgi:hypothetical protein
MIRIKYGNPPTDVISSYVVPHRPNILSEARRFVIRCITSSLNVVSALVSQLRVVGNTAKKARTGQRMRVARTSCCSPCLFRHQHSRMRTEFRLKVDTEAVFELLNCHP